MNPTDLTWVGTAGAAVFAGWQAYRANKQTKATGNGFARHTTEALERIEKQGAQTHDLLLEHLADHAGSDLARKRK